MALVKTEIMVAAPPGDRTSYINVYHFFQFVLQSFSQYSICVPSEDAPSEA